jgi:hypothetical protein
MWYNRGGKAGRGYRAHGEAAEHVLASVYKAVYADCSLRWPIYTSVSVMRLMHLYAFDQGRWNRGWS